MKATRTESKPKRGNETSGLVQRRTAKPPWKHDKEFVSKAQAKQRGCSDGGKATPSLLPFRQTEWDIQPNSSHSLPSAT